jgi:hypothetical protein
MANENLPKIEPVDNVAETQTAEVPFPSLEPKPNMIITTNRKTPINRGVPLKETHGMTTEAERFKAL